MVEITPRENNVQVVMSLAMADYSHVPLHIDMLFVRQNVLVPKQTFFCPFKKMCNGFGKPFFVDFFMGLRFN